MKNLKFKIQTIIIAFISLLTFSPKVNAAIDFVRYLPTLGDGPLDPNNIEDLGGLINYLFNLGLWIVGIAIFIQFARAGIEWFLAGPNLTKVSTAKARMKNAALGFILLLSAWLILYVINPDLVNSTINLPGAQPVK